MNIPYPSLIAGLCLLTAATRAGGVELGAHGVPADWPEPILDAEPHSYVLFDQLEYRNNDGPNSYGWDALAWLGGDYRRLWIETEGENASDSNEGEIERLDLQYGRLIAPFWDLQAGLGYQRIYGPGPDRDRISAVIGLQGLAPYWFEVDTNLRVSENGDVSVDLEAEYELLFTQRLILQPRFETAFAAQGVDDFGVGQGLNSVGLGLRLRYEIRRQFAPYVGFSWVRKLGDTADLAKDDGDGVSDLSAVAGVRIWF